MSVKLFYILPSGFMNECEIETVLGKNRKRKKKENFPPATETINSKECISGKRKIV